MDRLPDNLYEQVAVILGSCVSRRAGKIAALLIVLCVAALPATAKTPAILAFGDSLTSGFGLPADQSFPARLEAKLRADGFDARVINAGVAGDTTAGGLARLDWALADKPDLVILELGANDALRGIEPAAVRANLEKMIAKIQASGAKLLLTGMRALANFGEDYRRDFERIYPELGREHNVPLYPFFLEGVAMEPELNQPDGLHPNERGVTVVADGVAPVVERLLGGKSS